MQTTCTLETTIDDTLPVNARTAEEETADWQTKGRSALGLIELLLKRPDAIDALNRRPAWQREMFPRLVLISLVSYLVYGTIMALLFNLMSPQADAGMSWIPPLPSAAWHDGGAVGLVLAYAVGVLLAAGICLPSFYFYSLLAGLRMSWAQITSVIGKGTAANSVLLLGVLPIYAAWMLGMIILKADAPAIELGLRFGLLLPFLAGLWGLRAIYLGVADLCAHSAASVHSPRPCFLSRLVLSWAVVYTAVVPVLIYRLWEQFSKWFA